MPGARVSEPERGGRGRSIVRRRPLPGAQAPASRRSSPGENATPQRASTAFGSRVGAARGTAERDAGRPGRVPRRPARRRWLLLLALAVIVVAWARGRTLPPEHSEASTQQAPKSSASAAARFAAPAGLNPLACRMYAPTGPAVHRTIFVDAGHGGVDPGAIGVSSSGALVQEKTITLAVAQQLLPKLRAAGYAVLMSRIADVPVTQLQAGDTDSNGFTLTGEHKDTAARIQCANAGHADLLLAIHFNSFSDPSAGGAETIYDASRPFAAQNKHFAGLVQRELIASFSAEGWTVPDRGTKDDSQLDTPAFTSQAENYGHLLELGPAQAGWLAHPSAMAGALTEPLFVTDRAEADVAVNPRGQQAMASALAAAVAAYFAPPTASASAVTSGSPTAPLGASAAP